MKTNFKYFLIVACLAMGMPGSVWGQDEPEEYVVDLSDVSTAFEDIGGYLFTNLTLKNGKGVIYTYKDEDGIYDNAFQIIIGDNYSQYIYLEKGGTLKLVNWGDASNKDFENNWVNISFANEVNFVAENCYTTIEVESANPSSIRIKGGEIKLYGYDDFLRTSGDDKKNDGHVTALEEFIVEDASLDCSRLYLYDDDGYWFHNNGRVFDKLHTIKITSNNENDYCKLADAMFDGCYKVTTLDLNHAGLTEIPQNCFRYYSATEITLPPHLKKVGISGFGRESYGGGDNNISTGVWYYEDDEGQVHKKIDTASGKQIHIAIYPSAYQVKYWDSTKGDYVIGFPETLEYLDDNAFYGHRMHDIHIHKNMKYLGAYSLAAADLDQGEKNPVIFTFDEDDYARPIHLGNKALYNAYPSGGGPYEIRVPQKFISNFLYYDENATTDDKRDDDYYLSENYYIKYALEQNAVKPYVKFTASTKTAVDGEEENNAYKQTAWMPYNSKPEKISRIVAKKESYWKEKYPDGQDVSYDHTTFDWAADRHVNAYYVGGKFIKKNEGDDKVVLTAVNDTIVPANTAAMITSNKTTTDASDMMIVTFNLGSTGFDGGQISNQKFYHVDQYDKYNKNKELVFIDPEDSEKWQQTYGAPVADVNWLKAYTTLDDDGFMQKVQALRYSWNGTEDINYTNFVLNSGVFKLLQTSGDSPLPEGKAIMSMPSDKYTRIASGSNAKAIQMVFADDEDVVTGISEHPSSITNSSDWYNLMGQRVVNPQHGVFIKNGKKYIKK